MCTLHEDRYTHLIISRSVFLRMRNVPDKICVENQNRHFMFNSGFVKNCSVYEIITIIIIIIIIIIFIIFLHGLGRFTCSGIDALPSFPGASTISSSSRFVVEGVFREAQELCFSLQNEHHPKPAAPNLQHTTNWEQDDRCGNSTTESQAPEDGCINVRNMLST